MTPEEVQEVLEALAKNLDALVKVVYTQQDTIDKINKTIDLLIKRVESLASDRNP